MNRRALNIVALFVCLGVCFAAAGIGSWLTASSLDDWYAQLQRPSFAPPDGVFGPVWSTLYFLMALATWLVWRQRQQLNVVPALALFVVQLLLNVAWSALFFGWQNPLAALLEIVLLWLAIAATLLAFWRIVPLAGMLFAPYLAWVTFAVALNFEFWRLNS